MRIIAGKYKGRKIHSAPISNLRPTLGRVKETLFAIIENNVELYDAYVLDIFAGTGNLGLEALSRGASKVVFLENNINSIKLIKQNVETFSVFDKIQILQYDVFKGIDYLKKKGVKFDLIIMDPPFRNDYLNRILKETDIISLLNDDGLFVCEVEKKYEINYDETVWELIKEKKIADSRLYFLKTH